MADRSATFRDALIHLTNCANGRAKLKSKGLLARLAHCDIPSSAGPTLHGPAVPSLAAFLGVTVEDVVRTSVFATTPILPVRPAVSDHELKGGCEAAARWQRFWDAGPTCV